MKKAGSSGEKEISFLISMSSNTKDVPEAEWNYTLGGYLVLKKWLSYRESPLLGRLLLLLVLMAEHHSRGIVQLHLFTEDIFDS